MKEIKEILLRNNEWQVFDDEIEDGYGTVEYHKESLKKTIEELEAYINSHYIAKEKVEKPIKTLIAIESVVSDDFMESACCKLELHGGRDKNTFTQKEAQEMVRKLIMVYHLSHNIVASCCKNTHDRLLEEVYNGTVSEINKAVDDLVEDNE